MKSILRLLSLAIFLLAACTATPTQFLSPSATSVPPTLEPTITVVPSATQTASLTVEPSATQLPPPTATPTLYPTVISTPVQPVTGLPQGTDGYPWWNDSVFYEIFVRSFADSNGDGIGDFNGITAKLDYLNDGNPETTSDLGVTGLWLMPIMPSPSYHGYDVIDYYAVNPDYGTMEDFKHFVDEAHKRGIRVTIDWVLNHTSSQNKWFLEAQDPNSPYRNWYVWQKTRPTTPGWIPGSGQAYYYAFFGAPMPDLNYTNPAVVDEMKKVVRFWLEDVGIDGFRLDAAKYIIEDGATIENTAATHDFYKDMRKYYKGVNPQAMTVGEVWDDSNDVRTYLSGDQLDLAFDFDLAKNIVFAAGTRTPKYATDVLVRDTAIFLPGQFATFLTNHDQDRAMSVLNNDLEAAKTAAALLLTFPGVPYLYYGEEIGMLGKKPDENIRLPMQWNAEANAGFTNGTPWRAPGSDYPTKNVAAESADPYSLLTFYRTLIHLRSNHAALRVGDFHLVMTNNRAVYAALRVCKEETVLVLMNLSSEPTSDYELRLPESSLSGTYTVSPLLGFGEFTSLQADDKGGFAGYIPMPEIPEYGRLVLQLKK
jgi:glycosidase